MHVFVMYIFPIILFVDIVFRDETKAKAIIYIYNIIFVLFLQAIFVMSTINYSELDYKRPSGTYVYPNWAIAVGWTMAAFSAIFIPLMIPVQIYKYGLKADVSSPIQYILSITRTKKERR